MTNEQVNKQLDKILTKFNDTPDSEKYKFIADLKSYWQDKPHLSKAQHPLHVALIEFHIQSMQAEQQTLTEVKRQRSLQYYGDGIADGPALLSGGHMFLTKQISDRCDELSAYISQYTADLQSRSSE